MGVRLARAEEWGKPVYPAQRARGTSTKYKAAKGRIRKAVDQTWW